jgi:hypothetical protein
MLPIHLIAPDTSKQEPLALALPFCLCMSKLREYVFVVVMYRICRTQLRTPPPPMLSLNEGSMRGNPLQQAFVSLARCLSEYKALQEKGKFRIVSYHLLYSCTIQAFRLCPAKGKWSTCMSPLVCRCNHNPPCFFIMQQSALLLTKLHCPA